ncbi:hypothetical protein H5162_20795 [Pseudoalteromonas sp. SR41-8]|uniref:hypothetical protein n=1 Tax=Pseudoalteromonas sp. SR41-8 TaxID=2760946 RepID=UPI0015FFAD1D|nr:hypothetical protein [Pseudoalteromonas sp. SR41-8]MBB1311851.1 hypothetical protein [Pseudoalteromonas sp. SR41-8]
MKERIGFITFVTLLVAVLGVIAPIAWDYYNAKKDISLTVVSRSIVISPSAEVDGLKVSYKGIELNTLSKTTFLIENTGSRPLLKSEVVSPIKIEVPKKVKVLDAIIDSQVPSNLDVNLIRNNGVVEVHFSLLNPSDKVFFSLLTDSNKLEFSASARVAGVSELAVLDTPPKTLTIWALLWIPVAIISSLLALVSLVGFSHYPQEYRIKRALKNNSFVVPDFSSIEEGNMWVKETFYFMMESEIESITNHLSELDRSGNGFTKDTIGKIAIKTVEQSYNNLIMALFVGGVGLFGLYYSLNTMGYL